ncbi:MAG: ABC transporter permease [Solirubrobacterales bacterium]
MSAHGSAAGGAATELRTIGGPSALSGGWQRCLRLVWRMARTDFVLRYHGSVLGYVWSLLSPLLLFGVLYFAFTHIVKVGRGVPDYPAMLLFNLMLFQFFTEATERAVTSIVAGENLVRGTEFPRLAVPLSIVLGATFSLGLNMIVVFGFALASGVQVRATWLLFPLLLVALYVVTVSCSLLLSTLYVRFRDVNQIWTVLTRALFYLTPVVFPVEFYPAAYKPLLVANPLAVILIQGRVWIIDPGAPTFAQVAGGLGHIVIPTAITVLLCAYGIHYFNLEAPRVAEEL